MEIPDSVDWTQLVRQMVTLHPEKFGVLGSYSRELLQAEVSRDYSFAIGDLALRLTTSVLCGHVVTEKPQVQLNLPATWWQHLKYEVFGWHSASLAKKDTLGGFHRTVLLWPAYWLLGKYSAKRPVKWTTVTAEVTFEQRVLYPEIDMPASAGRPVIYETVDVSYPEVLPPWGSRLRSDPSRFLNRHEIASEVFQDPDGQRYGVTLGPDQTLHWLEKHGVNVDQLVKRH